MKLGKIARRVKRKMKEMEPTSPFGKFLVVTSYKAVLKLSGKYKRRTRSIIKLINTMVPEERAEDSAYKKKLLNEILYCRFMYGIAAKEYFVYEFEKLSHEGRKTFVTRGNKYGFYKKFNNPNYVGYFNQKTETYRKFGKYYNRDVACLYDEADFEKFQKFVEKHNRLIYKPADDYGGHGIKIYDASEYESVEDLFTIIMANGFCVVEELIVQGHAIAQFHPESVNTMRIVAYRASAEETIIQWCFLRMGMGGSHTDNMSSGGLAAMVDPKTGVIYTTGRDWLGEIHMCHPDTGVQLVGFQIPEWDKLMALVKEISNVLPEVRFVGWDFAYSEKGWTFVEGNARPQCVSAQITEYNGKLHLYRAMNELYNMENRDDEGEDDDE